MTHMTLADIRRAVRRSRSETLVAQAFRKALGCPPMPGTGAASARVERYGGLGECFENRKRVRL